MKKSVVGVIAFSILLTGVNAFDLGDITKGLEKGKEVAKKAGVVKSPDDIVKDNINDKKNIEACKQYYHKNKIAYRGSNDILEPKKAKYKKERYFVNPDSLSKHDRDELDALIKSYQKAIKELEKQDFDISKHSKKNLDNHALCKFILTESKTLKADDHSKFDKETEKYDKK